MTEFTANQRTANRAAPPARLVVNSMTCHITTTAGRQDDRTITILVLER